MVLAPDDSDAAIGYETVPRKGGRRGGPKGGRTFRQHQRQPHANTHLQVSAWVEQEERLTLSSRSKSGDVIEPVLKPQWWVNCKPLAEEALKVSCHMERYGMKT